MVYCRQFTSNTKLLKVSKITGRKELMKLTPVLPLNVKIAFQENERLKQ